MEYKKLYEEVLKNICEKSYFDFDVIVELPMPSFFDKLVMNENAKLGAVFNKKLDESKATEDDYKEFVEYMYRYVGKEDELDKILADKGEDGDMEREKIKKLMLEYGAPKDVVEDFLNDLYEVKQDTEKMDDFKKDEEKGSDEYKDFVKENNIDKNDEKLKEMANDEKGHEDFLLNAQNIALLKATDEGKKLLINAPQMAKDELEKAIKDYLIKNKGE